MSYNGPLLSLAVAIGLWQLSGQTGSAQETPDTSRHRWVSPAVNAPRLQHRTFESAAVRTIVSYHIYTPQTVVIRELIPPIDATFRTIASRDARLIEGFSAGGYGAARLGRPRRFGGPSANPVTVLDAPHLTSAGLAT